MAAPQLAAPQPVGDLLLNIAAFRRNLRAENAAPNTVLAYIGALDQLSAYLASQGMPTDVAKVRCEHVESFIADLLERWKPARANHRFRSCQRFFN